MPNTRIVYPRGFCNNVVSNSGPVSWSGLYQGPALESPGDLIIDTTFKNYANREIATSGFEFKNVVITRFIQLIGDFEVWLRQQLTLNDMVHGPNLDFLIDTVHYLRNGHREMSPITRLGLMLEYPNTIVGCASPTRYNELSIVPGEFNDYITNWLSKDDGFDDMICSANILFGVSKTPRDPNPLSTNL